MSKCTDFPFFDPALDEDYISELVRIVAPDPRTFVSLCIRDIAAGYAAEVEEAARRLFPGQSLGFHAARLDSGRAFVVMEYEDGSDSEAS